MLLQEKNFTIRNATVADAQQLAIWWNDGAIMAHAGFPKGIGQTAEQIAESLEKDTDHTHRRLIMEWDGVAIGEMCYKNKGEGVVEIGIKICDFSKQEKGMGKIFLSMLITALFQEKYQKIALDTNLANKRAQHVYEQLGFRKIRINQNSWTDQLGEKQSSVDYEMYPQDFISFLPNRQ